MSLKIHGVVAVLGAAVLVLSLAGCEDAPKLVKPAGEVIDDFFRSHPSAVLPPKLLHLEPVDEVALDAAKAVSQTPDFQEKLSKVGDAVMLSTDPLCAKGLHVSDDTIRTIAQDLQAESTYQIFDPNYRDFHAQATALNSQLNAVIDGTAPTLADKEQALQAADQFRELFCVGHDLLE
jgi:hypothetical protein